MLTKNFFSIMLASLLPIIGCSKQGSEKYFPLNNGAQWEYSIEMLASGGNSLNGKAVKRVDGEQIINGKRYVKVVVVTQGIPGVESQTYFYRAVPEEGIYFIDKKYFNLPEQLFFPMPEEVGKRWKVKTPKDNFQFVIESIENSELFNRKYENCLRITFNGSTMIDGTGKVSINGVSHYAPSIGEVQTIMEMKTKLGDRLTLTSTLQKYKN